MFTPTTTVSGRAAVAGRSIWVSGAGGFVGGAVVRALAAAGASVRAHVGPRGEARTPPGPLQGASFGAIEDPAVAAGDLAGVEVAIHLAGPPSVAASFAGPAAFARVHVTGTANVLEACRRHGVARLIYVSSAEVYGHPHHNPVGEEHPLLPLSPYGAAKVGAEHLVRTVAASCGLEAVILRPFSVYGPGQSANVVAEVVRQALAGCVVELGEPDVVRDFCFVGDVAGAVLQAAACPLEAGGIPTFNVGSGRGTSLRALAGAVASVLGRRIVVRRVGGARRPHAGVPELVADPARAAVGLGWRARTPFGTGLAAAIEGQRQQGKTP